MTIPAQDIVERLTERAAECATASASDDKDRFMNVVAKLTRTDGVLMTEAADTISRLTAENEALRKALERIETGYGPNHLSKFCRDVASTTLANEEAGR